nr:hypothetical protein [Tanacetum cinerariifolium]
MAQSSNVSSSVVQDVVNGHVFESPNGHVSHLPNGHVLGMLNGHVSELPNGHNSQLLNRNGVQLASVNVAQLPDEHAPQLFRARLLTVLYREVSAVRCRLMMKEVELKIDEKNICIGRLRRNGAV